MADAAACFISPTHDPALEHLAEELRHLRRSRPMRAWLALGGSVFVGPEGPIDRPPAALRSAAAEALVDQDDWHAVVVDAQPWLLQGRLSPAPVCLGLGLRTPDRASAMAGDLCAAIERVAGEDPLFVARCTTPSLWALLGQLRPLAATTLPLLLSGATGTGKEVLARALHEASGRVGAFVPENCAALPESLLEAELFGARRGAFTGALTHRRGRVLQADGGTLFLDEVADLPLPLQAKLLRVLQEREVRALGSDHSRIVDLRCIAASHQDLAALVARGRFRQDLYYRLAGLEVRLPSLSERPDDLPPLVATLCARAADEGVGPGRWLEPRALAVLAGCTLPGNVRQLDHVLRVAMSLSPGPRITAEQMRRCAVSRRDVEGPEAQMIRRALEQARGVKAAAARRLGWSRQKLYRRLATLGLEQG